MFLPLEYHNFISSNFNHMIPPSILKFLRLLSENNNRDWFHENKTLYQKAKEDFELVTLQMIAIVNEADPKIGPLEPKDCIFRIFRDTRFSKDKTPYKNNFGAYVNRGGRKSQFAGYYLHIQPDSSFVACGIHMPDPKVLNAVRQEIYHYPEEFKKILKSSSVKNTFGDIVGDKLKMAPKGFDQSFQDIDLIKMKSFNLIKYLNDNEILDEKFKFRFSEMIKVMVPFNQFFNQVIADL